MFSLEFMFTQVRLWFLAKLSNIPALIITSYPHSYRAMPVTADIRVASDINL